MKKIGIFCIILLLISTLTACGNKEKKNEKSTEVDNTTYITKTFSASKEKDKNLVVKIPENVGNQCNYMLTNNFAKGEIKIALVDKTTQLKICTIIYSETNNFEEIKGEKNFAILFEGDGHKCAMYGHQYAFANGKEMQGHVEELVDECKKIQAFLDVN